ncbi:MAG: SPFH domain-containing protein [Wenzhouxiangellaceae bacterium]
MIQEKIVPCRSGFLMLAVVIVLQLLAFALLAYAGTSENIALILPTFIGVLIVFVMWMGFFKVQPKEAKVLQLFGAYKGTCHQDGLRWANPFYSKKPVSVRVRNFESGRLKVNDNSGSPIEIAAVVVWRVIDTAEAVFEVDDYEEFVSIQSESALRNLASSYPYDPEEEDGFALRSHPQEISESLKREIQERLIKAGVDVIEARISHLAYAPEIAQAMLRRQQASAIIAARTRIVEGAVGMVEMALDELNKKKVVTLDEERKAAMVSNLLVVLCSEESTTPVLNAGSLYQ